MGKDEYYEFIVSQLGEPTANKDMPVKDRERFEKIFPSRILEIWDLHGLPIFNYGQYSFVNPSDWEGSLSAWIDRSSYHDLGPFFALTKEAFGAIQAYSPSSRCFVTIDPVWGCVIGRRSSAVDEEELSSIIDINLLSKDDSKLDIVKTKSNKPLFKDVLKLMGALDWNEMYAFEPPRFLGGSGELETVVKVWAQPQFDVLLSFLGEVESVRFEMPSGL